MDNNKCKGECSKCTHMCIYSPFYEEEPSEFDLDWSIQALEDSEMI